MPRARCPISRYPSPGTTQPASATSGAGTPNEPARDAPPLTLVLIARARVVEPVDIAGRDTLSASNDAASGAGIDARDHGVQKPTSRDPWAFIMFHHRRSNAGASLTPRDRRGLRRGGRR